MRVLHYAIGGGLAHLVRAHAFLAARLPGAEATVLTASAYADDARVLGPIAHERAPERLQDDRDAFRGNQYLLVSAGYLHRIAQMPPLVGGRIYLGAWYDYGGAFGGVLENRTGNRYRHAISTGFLMDTLFGPLGLVGSWGEGGRGKIYFSIGRFF